MASNGAGAGGALATAGGEAIAGHVAITEQDFRAVWSALPQTRSAISTLACVVIAIPAFALMYLLVPHDTEGAPPLDRVLLFGAPVVVFILAVLGRGLLRGRVRWAQHAVADLRSTEGVDFVLDDQGIAIDAPGRKSTTAWNAMARCLDTKDAYALFLTPSTVMVLPKRAFAANDQARVARILAEKVPYRPLRGVAPQPRLGRLVLWVVLIVAFLAIWQFLAPNQ